MSKQNDNIDPSRTLPDAPTHRPNVTAIRFSNAEAVANLRRYLKEGNAQAVLKMYAHDIEIQLYLWLAYVEMWLESLSNDDGNLTS